MTQQHRSYDGYSSNAVDSLAIDSTAIFEESGASVSTNAYEAELRELLSINIDSVAFKKLYKNARKKHDEFSEQTFIYDKSSPQYVNVAGVFVYISKDGNQYSINLVNQYTADDWLFIKSLVFNTDGENASFEWDFKRDNDDGMIWEWSDIEVPSPTLSMLIDIANAKKAKVRYEGDKYYKAVVITATEKAALKRQLKLYKGLLLGYGR